MGGAVSQGINNDDIINKLKVANYIKTAQVEKVFRLVDRGNYILEDDRKSYAYKDTAWRKGNLHLSAPCIYAQVMEGLQLEKGMSFLNLGSGTGYLSTMAGLILGPYGTNHGVELYGEVIAYAREKLDGFISDSGAIDVLDFCKPQFVQGNAYLLGESVQQYDRVYCGAALMSSDQDMMQNLLKVGGILVTPVSDQLLQIERSDETNFNVKSLLPVSFSSLVRSSHEYEDKNVVLPPSDILALGEMCRLEIRKRLRDNIEKCDADLQPALIHKVGESNRSYNSNYSDTDETSDGDSHLNLNTHQDQLNALLDLATSFPMMRGIRNKNRILFSRESLLGTADEGTSSPSANDENRLEDDDSDQYTSDDESAMVCGAEVVRSEMLPGSIEHPRTPQEGNLPDEAAGEDVPSLLTEAFDICLRTTETALKRGLSDSSACDDTPHASSQSPSKSSEHKALKREKFDSGIGDEPDTDTLQLESSSDSYSYDDYEEVSDDSEEATEGICLPTRRRHLRLRPGARRRCRKRLNFGRKYPTCNHTSATPVNKYRELMASAIKRLPLPMPLKIYVNYNRDL